MTIAEVREKCKVFAGKIRKIPRDVLVIVILVLASSASFGLGYLAGLEASGRLGQGSDNSFISLDSSQSGQIIASKNGTKYYLPSCAGAEKISEANKIWFVSVKAAEAAGYSPAANCDGLRMLK